MKNILIPASVALAALTGTAAAQGFPDRPVTIVVPFPAGGAVDIVGRYLAGELRTAWGQPVVIQNQPGAGTSIGSAQVSMADADGYTLLLNSSSFTMNAADSPDLPYDLVEDFTQIAMVGATPLVLAAGPSLGATDFEGARAVSQTRPLTYATAGRGTINQFASELLGMSAGLNLIAVHYQGGAAALTDVMGGHADFFYSSAIQALPHIESGALTAILVSTEQRLPNLPDTPTVFELGVPDAAAEQWWGLFGPAGLDPAVVERINTDLAAILGTEAAREFFGRTGGYPRYIPAAEFAPLVAREYNRWVEIAAAVGLNAN